ncbi:MAG: mechanosensitive ion channel [Chlamydiales bacterium]|nr:mechanosensitive ion channel [Chlamydiales bacterium]
MHLLFGQESFERVTDLFEDWMFTYLLSMSAFMQVLVTIGAFLFAYLLSRPLRTFLKEHHLVKPQHEMIKESLSRFVLALCWIFVEGIIVGLCAEFDWPNHINSAVLSLLAVWVFVSFVSSFVKNVMVAKFLAFGAWIIAALHLIGLLDPTIAVLSQFGMSLGETRISLLDLMYGAAVLSLLLWAANSASVLFESRINQREDLEPTLKVLFSKLLRLFLIGCALLFAISAVGIDISALTVFGGALGLGIGFGLQKVISNLICGVILLLDRSVKPGDVISIREGKAYGTVNQLSARFVCLRSPSGEEYLVPNEEVITQGIQNWSYSDRNVRISLPIRVALDADIHQVMKVVLEASYGVRNVLPYPKSVVRVVGFGDWSIDLDLQVWVADPEIMSSVKSDVYLNVWDAFKREGISIPLPTREVRVAQDSNDFLTAT